MKSHSAHWPQVYLSVALTTLATLLLELSLTRIFSVVIIGFGVAILVVTLVNGGGVASSGLWLGLLFTAIGIARLYIALRSRS